MNLDGGGKVELYLHCRRSLAHAGQTCPLRSRPWSSHTLPISCCPPTPTCRYVDDTGAVRSGDVPTGYPARTRHTGSRTHAHTPSTADWNCTKKHGQNNTLTLTKMMLQRLLEMTPSNRLWWVQWCLFCYIGFICCMRNVVSRWIG